MLDVNKDGLPLAYASCFRANTFWRVCSKKNTCHAQEFYYVGCVTTNDTYIPLICTLLCLSDGLVCLRRSRLMRSELHQSKLHLLPVACC